MAAFFKWIGVRLPKQSPLCMVSGSLVGFKNMTGMCVWFAVTMLRLQWCSSKGWKQKSPSSSVSGEGIGSMVMARGSIVCVVCATSDVVFVGWLVRVVEKGILI